MDRKVLTILFSVLALKLHVTVADLNWWKSAVIYQIYPRSLLDTDGNGVGDLQGIIDKVQYIKDIGVDAVWLSPIYPSPDKDFGYDISDFRGINSLYGSMSLFEELVKKVHEAGLKIILDFVPNHSSNEHDWFKRSVQSDGKYKDYYVWRPGSSWTTVNEMHPPNNWVADIVHGSAWTYDKTRKEFYLHQFLPEQPDLNYENVAVQDEMISVLEFWLNKHVDGFRMDAVYTMCEDQSFADEAIGPNEERHHEYTFNQPKTYEILAKFRAKLEEYTAQDNDTRIMMVEDYNSNPYVIKQYYNYNKKPVAHFPFNFYLIMNITKEHNATDWANCINEYYNVMGDDWANWVLGNHDQNRVASRYSEEDVDLLNIILLALKGTAITYFGEEIGMPNSLVRLDQAQDPQGKGGSYDNFVRRSRDFERGPFLWNGYQAAGFSSNVNTWIPVSPSYWKINVEAQKQAPRSHLKVYQEMISLRRNKTLKYGDVQVESINDGSVLAIFRYYHDNPSVAAVINMDVSAQTVDLVSKRPSLPNRLHFYTASVNVNDYMDKDDNTKYKLYNSSAITLPPKGAIVLTTIPMKQP